MHDEFGTEQLTVISSFQYKSPQLVVDCHHFWMWLTAPRPLFLASEWGVLQWFQVLKFEMLYISAGTFRGKAKFDSQESSWPYGLSPLEKVCDS